MKQLNIKSTYLLNSLRHFRFNRAFRTNMDTKNVKHNSLIEENQKLKNRIELLERENKSLKKSVYEISIRQVFCIQFCLVRSADHLYHFYIFRFDNLRHLHEHSDVKEPADGSTDFFSLDDALRVDAESTLERLSPLLPSVRSTDDLQAMLEGQSRQVIRRQQLSYALPPPTKHAPQDKCCRQQLS